MLAIACLLPTLVTLLYFVWAAGAATSVQQIIYTSAKIVQFALPIVWVGWMCREKLRWPAPNLRGLGWGLTFGIAVAGAMGVLYMALTGTAVLTPALQPIREKIADLGIAMPGRFLALGIFYSLVHSLLEEYYWRWFVFGRMRQVVPLVPAIVISSLAFALHHVIVLGSYFSHSLLTIGLLAASIAVGGAFWVWLYHRCGSIYSVWASHLCVDAAIFAIGFDLARPMFER